MHEQPTRSDIPAADVTGSASEDATRVDLASQLVRKATLLLEAATTRSHDVVHQRTGELSSLYAPGTDRLVLAIGVWEQLDREADVEVVIEYARRVCSSWPQHSALNSDVVAVVVLGMLGDVELRARTPLASLFGACLLIAADYMLQGGVPARELASFVAKRL